MIPFHPSSFRRYPSTPPRRRGFTFAEVLFAVILLGIGFIMLAGMFPVAIQQSQESLSETTAANVAWAAARYVQENAHNKKLPDTYDGTTREVLFRRLRTLGTAQPDDLWEDIKFGAIAERDSRFAWTAVYRRNGADPYAQLVIFVLQARNFELYTIDDLHGGDQPGNASALASYPSPLEPKIVDVALRHYSDNTDVAWIMEPDLSSSPYPGEYSGYDTSRKYNFVAEGGYIVIAHDVTNQTEGSVYQLGRQLDNSDPRIGNNPVGGSNPIAFELVPGSDMTSSLDNIPPIGPGPQIAAKAYIVGKAYTAHLGPQVSAPGSINADPDPSPAVGRAQDIAVYSTYIPIKF